MLTAPWSTSFQFPALGETSEFSFDWVKQGIGMQALRDRLTMFHAHRDGTPLIEWEEFTGRLQNEFKGHLIELQLGGSPKSSRNGIVIWDDAGLTFYYNNKDKTIYVGIETTNRAFSEELCAFVDSVITETKPDGNAYVLTSGTAGLHVRSVGLAGLKHEEGNYTEEVNEGYQYVVENLKSNNPSGRMVILDGVPGSGKTSCVRSLLKDVPDGRFIMFPVSMLSQVDGPTLVPVLMDYGTRGNEPTILVVEDADECLIPRGVGEGIPPSLSTLLNITDGILGSSLRLFVLATTNASEFEIDAALKRPGRLMRRIHFQALEPSHAQEVFERITGKTRKFEEPTTIAKVYQLAKDEGWEPIEEKRKSRRLGFGEND